LKTHLINIKKQVSRSSIHDCDKSKHLSLIEAIELPIANRKRDDPVSEIVRSDPANSARGIGVSFGIPAVHEFLRNAGGLKKLIPAH
jgi:hypothetical protein